jgi:hypothetical protein
MTSEEILGITISLRFLDQELKWEVIAMCYEILRAQILHENKPSGELLDIY